MSTNIRWFDENKNERNTTVAVPSDIPTIPSVPKITYDTFTVNLNQQSSGVYTVTFTQGTYDDLENSYTAHRIEPHFNVSLLVNISTARVYRWSLINFMGPTLYFYGTASSSGIDENVIHIRYMLGLITRVYTDYEFEDNQEMKIYVEYLT